MSGVKLRLLLLNGPVHNCCELVLLQRVYLPSKSDFWAIKTFEVL